MKGRKLPTGIRKRKGKYQAYVRVNGTLHWHTFPAQTDFATIEAWRTKTRLTYATPKTVSGSFQADIDIYLSRITAMPTYHQKAAHLALWAEALGRDRPRAAITATEIDQVLQRWLAAGLDPQTVRKRRTSLLSLFVTLDGKTAANPVRGSKCPRAPKPEDRGTDYATIRRILEAMPVYRDTKKGAPKQRSLAPIRAAVLAYTGVPPGMLGQLQATDLNLHAGTVRFHVRVKGGGVEARTVHLTPGGLTAFRQFHAVAAYGRFNVEKLNVSFKRACRKVGVTGLTLYDLRHSFGAQLYLATRDQATVGRFMLHAEGSPTTARYTKAAHRAVDAAAAKVFRVPSPKKRRRKLASRVGRNRQAS